MAKPELSERQKRILEYIAQYTSSNGRPPTIREIGHATDISSTSVVNYNLNKLREKGYVARNAEVARGLELTDKAKAFEVVSEAQSSKFKGITPSKTVVELQGAIGRWLEVVYRPYDFSSVFDSTAVGCRINSDGDVIELALNGLELESLPTPILQMENLRELHLNRNKLKSLPPLIDSLQNLNILMIRNNQLTSLPKEIGRLDTLEYIDVANNQLTKLPRELARLSQLKMIAVEDNPLEQPPPEITKQGIAAILEYLSSLPDESSEHSEAKLILVGDGEVGKTCLANRLVFNSFSETTRTVGICVLNWNVLAPSKRHEKVQLNLWDFGGQEIYHSTHQFFLTKRSVYMLVWNARKSGNPERLSYWLNAITARGGDSPVILVMTKQDEFDGDLNLKDVKERFPQVVDAIKVDSKSGRGISVLTDLIRKVVWELPLMRTRWVSSWYRVRHRLESDTRTWISYDEFRLICLSEELNDKQIDILDEYLPLVSAK